MGSPDHALIDAVRTGLAEAGDPAKALQMQAYMKSPMPFHGVQTPTLRAVCRKVFATHPLLDRDAWLATARAMWREATHREERYAAIALTGDRRYRAYQGADLVSGIYAKMIDTGAWWDLVDEVAIRRIGPILRDEPAVVTPIMYEWADAESLWRRRTAIICQIGSKGATNLDLLTFAIEHNAADTRFFVRKAIGWALREYAKHDPNWVRAFVSSHEAVLSALSRREALRNIDPSTKYRRNAVTTAR